MPQENQLLLKLFFPFCYHKCSYCGQSICSYDDKVLKAYYQAMLNEMESAATEMQDMVIPAISLEGGTPLLASPEMLQTLLRFVHKTFPLTKDVQIQVQTMPGQYSRSLVQQLQNVGVNFWTIGLETANLMEHKLLCRPYRFDALTMVDVAIRTFHIRNLDFSLLYGIPGQTMQSWKHSLDMALAYSPEHLTLTSLRLIPGTPLAKRCQTGELSSCSLEAAAEYYEYARELLLSLGYQPYTITNFARPGCENRWKLSQLLGTPYMGFGYQADSYLDGVFYTNGHNLREYIENSSEISVIANHMVRLDSYSEMLRFVVSHLTLTKGLCLHELKEHFGDIADNLLQNVFPSFIADGFLTEDMIDNEASSLKSRCVRLTPMGLVSDILNRLECI